MSSLKNHISVSNDPSVVLAVKLKTRSEFALQACCVLAQTQYRNKNGIFFGILYDIYK
jgi:hypothetical protein